MLQKGKTEDRSLPRSSILPIVIGVDRSLVGFVGGRLPTVYAVGDLASLVTELSKREPYLESRWAAQAAEMRVLRSPMPQSVRQDAPSYGADQGATPCWGFCTPVVQESGLRSPKSGMPVQVRPGVFLQPTTEVLL